MPHAGSPAAICRTASEDWHCRGGLILPSGSNVPNLIWVFLRITTTQSAAASFDELASQLVRRSGAIQVAREVTVEINHRLLLFGIGNAPTESSRPDASLQLAHVTEILRQYQTPRVEIVRLSMYPLRYRFLAFWEQFHHAGFENAPTRIFSVGSHAVDQAIRRCLGDQHVGKDMPRATCSG
jgi:hypothetical protein